MGLRKFCPYKNYFNLQFVFKMMFDRLSILKVFLSKEKCQMYSN